jgi:oxygen-independent coproporphyrinogen III oxidase
MTTGHPVPDPGGAPPPPGDEPVRSVYIHAPFCARRCFYCDFAVTVDRAPDPVPWLHSIEAELRLLEEDGWVAGAPLETLYVGGGTPSLLGTEAMAGLARILGPHRLESPGLEWTVEANPESVTPELAAGWRRAGVNRVSLGVQSFQEPVLRWMGRLHGAAGAIQAVGTLRKAGFENISVDLIFGLPARLDRSWREDLEQVQALELPHVSLYGLTAEEGTPLYRAVGSGRETLADPDRYREEYLEAAERLGGAGYLHYEVSNLCRPGMEARHNAVYWSGESWMGLGNSAHAFRFPVRRWNLRDWAEYRGAVLSGQLPVANSEVIGPEEARLERIWLGLRTSRGLSRSLLSEAERAVAQRWDGEGWTLEDPGFLRLSAEGWLLLDRLTVELDGAGVS